MCQGLELEMREPDLSGCHYACSDVWRHYDALKRNFVYSVEIMCFLVNWSIPLIMGYVYSFMHKWRALLMNSCSFAANPHLGYQCLISQFCQYTQKKRTTNGGSRIPGSVIGNWQTASIIRIALISSLKSFICSWTSWWCLLCCFV